MSMSDAEPTAGSQTVSGGRPHQVHVPGWVRAVKVLSTVLVVPAGVACLVLMLHVIADVGGRTLFNEPITGTLEISSNWWMVTIVFLGFGYTQLRREHVRATVITEMLPQRWERVADIAAIALLGVFAVAMGYNGWNAAVDSFEIREASSVFRLPIWPVAFLVPIGCLSLVLQCAASIYEAAHGIGHEAGDDGVI